MIKVSGRFLLSLLVVLLGGFTQINAHSGLSTVPNHSQQSFDNEVHFFFNPSKTSDEVRDFTGPYVLENETEEDELDFGKKFVELDNYLVSLSGAHPFDYHFSILVRTAGSNFYGSSLRLQTQSLCILFRTFRI